MKIPYITVEKNVESSTLVDQTTVSGKNWNMMDFQELDSSLLLNLLPDPWLIIDEQHHILRCSQATRSIFCIDDAWISTHSFKDLISEDLLISQPLHTSPIAAATEKEVRFKSGDGKFDLHARLSIRRIFNDRKQTPFFFIVVRDISEYKRTELDLLRFYNIAQYTINPVEITDANGSIIYVNPAFERSSGYSKEEMLGNNPKLFGSGRHPKSFWEQMWKMINSGNVWVGKVENRKKDGTPFYSQLLISPIIDGSKKIVGYFGVHRDISEQKFLEEQLAHAQKMEIIGTMAAGIAHEVGNPLASISSIVQVVQRTTNDEFAKEKLELVKSQVNRISKIIHDLVDFSRPSNYQIQNTDIAKCILQALEIVRAGKKAKHVKFEVNLKGALPPLQLVPDQIEQVFINVFMNAVDAVNNLPTDNSQEIYVSAFEESNEISIVIQDNGSGIADENLPKIFEPFFTTKKVGEGTGLGLWVSYGIIKTFRGDIKVESVEGRGTTFTITLPIRTE